METANTRAPMEDVEGAGLQGAVGPLTWGPPHELAFCRAAEKLIKCCVHPVRQPKWCYGRASQ